MFSFNILQQSNIRDLSLKNIAVMFQANTEEIANTPCIANVSGCMPMACFMFVKKKNNL